jgi:hypothetical protein
MEMTDILRKKLQTVYYNAGRAAILVDLAASYGRASNTEKMYYYMEEAKKLLDVSFLDTDYDIFTEDEYARASGH